MRQLLDRSLLSPAAQEVVDRILDQAWLEKFPTLSPTFLRYGHKGGSLGTQAGLQILTWSHYMETVGGRFVVAVFLRDMLSTRNAPTVADLGLFAQRFATTPAFRQRVRDAIGGATLATELAPKITKITTQGRTVTVNAEVWNTSPVASGGAVKVSLFLLNGTNPTGKTAVRSKRVGLLAGYKSKAFTLRATSAQDISGRLAVLVIDPEDEIAEQDEKNNVTWERLK